MNPAAARNAACTPDEGAIRRTASLVGEDIAPGDDLHVSAAFRLHLAQVLTARVLRTAAG